MLETPNHREIERVLNELVVILINRWLKFVCMRYVIFVKNLNLF